MAQASFTSLSLSLDSFLKPFLAPSSSSSTSGRHSHRLLSSLRCAPQPPTTTTFVSPLSLSRRQTLSTFSRIHHLQFPFTSTPPEAQAEAGDVNVNTSTTNTLLIRPMLDSEIDAVSELLAESFIETLFFPPHYTRLLAFLVKNYLLERIALLPHTAFLVGIFLNGDGGAGADADADANDQSQSQSQSQPESRPLVCTAEISFDQRGANAASPTPIPPPDCPYICNMTVRNSFRRRGIGKLLLKACEDLITKMTDKRDVYLHCRVVDKVPLRMYKKAGYQVVKTDSFLVWLTLQRRKYLMRKTLTDSDAPKSEVGTT